VGAFYVNYTVRSSDQAAVVKSMKGRSACVMPAKDGAVVVTDEAAETQEIDAVREVGEPLSTSLKTQCWRCSTTTTTCCGSACSTRAA
jgi:hypothetical protein